MQQHKPTFAIDLAEFNQGWRIVCLALLGIATSAAAMPIYGFGPMVLPLEQSLGWDRSEILATTTFSVFGSVFANHWAGTLNRRYGIRRVTLISLLILPLIFVALSQLDRFGGSIWALYILFFFITWAGVGTLQVSWTQVVNLWFEKNRGLALAMVLSGSGVSGMVLPTLLTGSVEQWGWRAGFLVLALLPILITFPLALWWLRTPDERPKHKAAAPTAGLMVGMMLREAIRDRRYWTINICMVLVAGASMLMVLNIVPLLQDKGFAAMEASQMFGALAVSLVAGRVVVGYMVDRFWAPAVAFVAFLLPGLGCLIMAFADSTWLLVAGIGLIGIGAGAEFDLAAFLIARYFGMRDYGRLFGLQMAVISAGICLSPTMVAVLYAQTGNYDAMLIINMVLFFITSIALLTLGRYPVYTRDNN